MKLKISAIILLCLLVFASYGETLHRNKGRGYKPFKYATTDGVVIDNTSDSLLYDYLKLPEPTDNLSVRFRSANLHGNPGKRYEYISNDGEKRNERNPKWGFFLAGESDTIIFEIKRGEKFELPEPVPGLEISLYKSGEGEVEKEMLIKNINPYAGDNLWCVSLDKGFLKLQGGDKRLQSILNTSLDMEVDLIGFFAGWGSKIKIEDLSVEFENKLNSTPEFQDILANLDEYLAESEDPMEGYWVLFDRELEENLLKNGGDYTLACVKDGENYNFIYIDGASVNSKEWSRGDLKATISPTPFGDIFNVMWYDAMKEPVSHDIKAQKGEGNTLMFQFPYQSSKFRLRKIP